MVKARYLRVLIAEGEGYHMLSHFYLQRSETSYWRDQVHPYGGEIGHERNEKAEI